MMVSEHTDAGHDVVLEIDWQGAQQIRKHYPESVGIFILPPSLATLEERLRKRAQDTDEVIARRVQAASSEIAHAPEFEYVIINTEFELALNQLIAIVQASRCQFSQQAERNRSLFANFGIHVKQN
jgi:guanylate kinase